MTTIWAQSPPLLALTAPPVRAALPAPPQLQALTASASVSTAGAPPSNEAGASQGASAAPQLLAIDAAPWSVRTLGASPAPGTSAANFSASCGGPFVPSYEWGVVPEGASVPPGLEVRLSVDGSGLRTARISSSWRLLVVAEAENESCRLDVTRHTTLAEVRSGVAGSLTQGDESRVLTLLADKAVIAGLSNPGGWSLTVERAALFGCRVTVVLRPDLSPEAKLEELRAQLEGLENAVAKVEGALGEARISVGQGHAELAQLEAQLDRLQCKGIDALAGGGDQVKQQRKELTRRTELLSTRLGGIFVGLGAAKRRH